MAELLSAGLQEQITKSVQEAIRLAVIAPNADSNGDDDESDDTTESSLNVPTADQLAKINALTGKQSSADDWYVCKLRASDNLLWRRQRKWHPNILNQMATRLVGSVMLKDHSWEYVDSAVGFIFEAGIAKGKVPAGLPQVPGSELLNSAIAKKEQYLSVECWAAIRTSCPEVIDAIESRAYHAVSTGGVIPDQILYCPDCTEKNGKDTAFNAKDVKGLYTCPHFVPNPWTEMFGDDEEKARQAKYAVVDGSYDSYELSFCVAGALPAAGVMRG